MALCRFLFFVILKSPPTSDSDFRAMRIDSLFMYMLPEKSQYTLVIILLVEIFTEKRFSSAKKEKEKETFKGWAGTAILVEVEKNAFRKGSQDSPIPIFQS
ncbi:uncharacterized protein [Gossypium hirsutum]|uniref:Uncharacterized protein isoform X4 n=1 Tax=Gossypium hirsutum TaxID=3635 RepID=A0A1U8MSB4_GOSHI|nr:uncharacterized protein LOC107939599 isoform X4 [Gossypium hirsutum]XP_016728429.2 uncharacterized protein LOC107939599 isoform X4 [Gossypium hirsutum]XP_040966524.1 uncharacterized protein LOC107939599 isoform X4 [Gossypium hirsutum]XP_040966525.1 uncharacterized protein LOC107939599 isoform X4 [Gossypium hirsutum]